MVADTVGTLGTQDGGASSVEDGDGELRRRRRKTYTHIDEIFD